MPFFAGLAQGFSQAQTQDRQLQAQIDQQNAEREQSTLLHLATTHPDPEVRASALSTMLTPRTSGSSTMGRFFNQAKSNPMMPTLMQLMGSQRAEPVMGSTPAEPGPSTMQAPGAASTPPPSGELGIPQTSLGAAHDTLPQAPASDQQITRQVGTRMVSRGAPPTTAQSVGQTEYERTAGQFRAFGDIGGGSNQDPQMLQLALNNKMGIPKHYSEDGAGNTWLHSGNVHIMSPGGGKASASEAGVQSQITDYMAANPGALRSEAETAIRTQAQSKFESGVTTAGARATTATVTAANAPQMQQARLAGLRQRAINESARLPGIQMAQEVQRRALNGQLTADEAYKIASPIIIANRGTTDDLNEMVTALTGGTAGGTPTAPAAQPPPGGPASATPASTSAAVPPPGAAQATPAVPPEVQQVLKGAGPGRHTLSDGSVWNLSATGAITADTAPVPPAGGAGSAPAPAGTPGGEAGTTTPPAPAKPGLPGNLNVAKLGETEQGAHDVITAARPMMERARAIIQQLGGADANSVAAKGKGLKAAVQSWAGFNPSSPAYKELLPLLQHIRVYALSPYLHGIRNGAFVSALQENAPENADTPAHMITKLDNLEANFKDIERGFGSAPPPAKAAVAPPAR